MTISAFRRLRSLLILLVDLLLILGTFSWVYYLRLDQLPNYSELELWLIIATFIATLFISGTYYRGQNTSLPQLPIRTFFLCLVAGIICIFWVYLLGPLEFNNYFGRGVLPTGTVLIGILTTLTRLIVNRLYFLQEGRTELLYLGFSSSGEAFLDELKNHSEIRSVSILADQHPPATAQNISVLTHQDSYTALQRNWSGIVIDPDHIPNKEEASKLVSLRLSGTPIHSLAEYYERNWYMVPVNHIGDDWFLNSNGFSMQGNPISLRFKRIADVLLSLTLLTISIPVTMLCALLIKASSRGPVLFRQTRVGLQGKPFTIYKLRTMIEDAELDGAQWASKNDPRITKVGEFLRKSRLDEIPQCWNVLKGEMSFVGPRPERPEFTEKLASNIPYYELRHMVQPGISGWAQVIFPYGASEEDALKKLQYELYYIKNQSLLLDLNIILRTLIIVIQRAGR